MRYARNFVTQVKNLVAQGLPYATKVSYALPQLKQASADVFIYWKPGENKLALRIKKAASDKDILKVASALNSNNIDINPYANENTGYVCLYSPDNYYPIDTYKKFEKQAFVGSPAGLALTGSLLGSAGLGAYTYWKNREEDPQERKRLALIAMALGAGIGATPGVVNSVYRWNKTKDPLTGKHDVGYLEQLFMKNDTLGHASPNFTRNRDKFINDWNIFFPFARRNYTDKNPDGTRKYASYKQASFIDANQFSNTLWNDVNHGLVSPQNGVVLDSVVGSTAIKNNSSYVTPGQVTNTLINAGIGRATGAIIGGTLGALFDISEDSQKELRNIGMWGGILNGLGNEIRRN